MNNEINIKDDKKQRLWDTLNEAYLKLMDHGMEKEVCESSKLIYLFDGVADLFFYFYCRP
jgi:hypothetical protein